VGTKSIADLEWKSVLVSFNYTELRLILLFSKLIKGGDAMALYSDNGVHGDGKERFSYK